MGLLDRFMNRLVRRGELVVIDHRGRRHHFGTPVEGRARVVVRLADRRVVADLVRNPRLGAGEAFMDGRLIIESDPGSGTCLMAELPVPGDEEKPTDGSDAAAGR